MLFRDETDATLCTGPPSLKEEVHSTDKCWMEAVDTEVLEGDLDSFTEDKEAVEFPFMERSTAESKEEVEEDREEVCCAGLSSAEAQEEEGMRGGEAVLSAVSF